MPSSPTARSLRNVRRRCIAECGAWFDIHRQWKLEIGKGRDIMRTIRTSIVAALIMGASTLAFAQSGGGGGGTAGGNGAGQGGTGMSTPNAHGATGSTSGASGANTMDSKSSNGKMMMKKKSDSGTDASGGAAKSN
jgi:hypothetical protein